MLSCREIEFPSMPRASDDAAVAAMFVFVNLGRKAGTGHAAFAHRRCGMRAYIAPGIDNAVDEEDPQFHPLHLYDLSTPAGFESIHLTSEVSSHAFSTPPAASTV